MEDVLLSCANVAAEAMWEVLLGSLLPIAEYKQPELMDIFVCPSKDCMPTAWQLVSPHAVNCDSDVVWSRLGHSLRFVADVADVVGPGRRLPPLLPFVSSVSWALVDVLATLMVSVHGRTVKLSCASAQHAPKVAWYTCSLLLALDPEDVLRLSEVVLALSTHKAISLMTMGYCVQSCVLIAEHCSAAAVAADGRLAKALVCVTQALCVLHQRPGSDMGSVMVDGEMGLPLLTGGVSSRRWPLVEVLSRGLLFSLGAAVTHCETWRAVQRVLFVLTRCVWNIPPTEVMDTHVAGLRLLEVVALCASPAKADLSHGTANVTACEV